MIQIIGYVIKDRFGLPKIVFGELRANAGLSFAKYEIKEGGSLRILRLDGIIASSEKRVRQLLKSLKI